MILKSNESILVIVDVQTSLQHAIINSASTIRNIQTLLAAKEKLNIPVIVTEQYPKGLGRTIVSILNFVQEHEVFSKTHFSFVRESQILDALQSIDRRQIVLSGMEAHVCVLQSALELKRLKYDVFVVLDAVSSQKESDYKAALNRLQSNNINVVSTEMVLFEWLEKACTKDFRDLLPLLKFK